MAEPVSTAAGASAAKAIGLGTIFFVFIIAAIVLMDDPDLTKRKGVGDRNYHHNHF